MATVAVFLHYIFRLMASQHKEYFDGSTSFTDAYDYLQAKAGNSTWLMEFTPSIEGSVKPIAADLAYIGFMLRNFR